MNRAFFWIASNKEYLYEANRFACGVKEQMPDVPRIIMTPTNFDRSDVFTDYVKLPDRKHNLWYLDFVTYMNEALSLDYDKLVYLDTDTYMCAPVYEVFDLLDEFNIAGTHAPGRNISPTTFDIPECFVELNTGVFAFQNNAAVRALFERWLDIYKANPALYGENDQAPLREALYGWYGRQYVLPPEYNCRFGFGGQASGMIKILHGRPTDLAAVAKEINRDQGIRGWRRGDFG